MDGRWSSLLVVFLLLLSGTGWLALLRYRPTCGPERLALAFGGGAAWLGVLTALFGAAPLFRPEVLVPCLLLPLAALALGREARAAALDRRSWLSGWPGFLPVVPLVALSFWFAVHRPVWTIDAQKRWVLHAQWTAAEHTATPETMQDPEWAASHPSYPPLVPSVLALALQLGADRDEGMRVVFPFYFAGLLGVVYSFARRRAPPVAASLLVLLLASTPCFSLPDESAQGAYGLGADAALADIPLAFFLTALLVLVLDAIDTPGASARPVERGRWRVAGLIGAGAVLTKNEGLVYAPLAIGLALAALLVARRGGALAAARRPLAVLLGVLVACAVLWKVASRDMAVSEGEGYVTAGVFESIAAGGDRLGAVARRVRREMQSEGLWGWIWALPALWLAWFAVTAPRLHRDELVRRALPFLWFAAGLVMVVVAYLATGWKEGNWLRLMNVSLARLLIHHVPLAVILLCELFVERERVAEPAVAT